MLYLDSLILGGRKEVFGKEIVKVLKKRQWYKIKKYSVNYSFIKFIMESRKWGKGSEFARLFEDIKKIRKEIVTQNLPLAINRARIFWSWTPESHLSYMDLIDIASEGLIISVDKYVCPPGGYTKVFRSVSIGRMVSGFIDEYSSTILHFFPSDKNKIYKANKLLKKLSNLTFEELAENLKKTGTETNEEDIRGLLTASSCVSSDVPINVNGGDDRKKVTLSDLKPIGEELQPDNKVEYSDLKGKVFCAIQDLSLFEKKFLLLKGVIEIDEYKTLRT